MLIYGLFSSFPVSRAGKTNSIAGKIYNLTIVRFLLRPFIESISQSLLIKDAAGMYSYIPKQEKNKCWEHRRIAEQVLNRKLHTNEVVHHLDENPKNNNLTNLIIISRKVHTSLHQFLKIQGVILEGSKNENNENCWDNLRVPMTTAWLETTDVKVLKLWEIGQSAAEPLS